jgi:hypothetical protein
MFKPKIVFTILAAWFAFHIFIFWVLNPSGVEVLVESEKGQFMARVMGYIGGTLCMMIAYTFFMLRDIELEKAKKILLGVGSIMGIADAVIISSNLSAYEKFPTEPMIATPQPAVALWIILTSYTIYVAVTTKK